MALQPLAPQAAGAQAICKGERHCGTNFIDAVLRHNFGDNAMRAWTDHSNTIYSGCDIAVQPRLALKKGGYAGSDSRYYCCSKHGVPSTACVWPHATPVAGVVFLMRLPYAWIPVMRTSPYGAVRVKQYANLSWFLRSPFPDYVSIKFGDATKGHYIMHETPMAMWSSKVDASRRYASELAVADGPAAAVFVSYTDLFNATALGAKLVPALAAWGFPLRTSTAHSGGRRADGAEQGSDAGGTTTRGAGDEVEGVVAADGFELPLDAEANATDNNKMSGEVRRTPRQTRWHTRPVHRPGCLLPFAPLPTALVCSCHRTPGPHRTAVHSRGVEGTAGAREQAQHVDAPLLRVPVGGRRLPPRRPGRSRLLQCRHPRRRPAVVRHAARAHSRAVGVQ